MDLVDQFESEPDELHSVLPLLPLVAPLQHSVLPEGPSSVLQEGKFVVG